MKNWKGLHIIKGSLVLALMLSVWLSCGQLAHAAETPDYRLDISPASMKVDLKPGVADIAEIKLKNTGSKQLGYEISVAPYSVEGEQYQQNISKETTYTDLVKWVTTDVTSGTLEPNEEKNLRVTIKVPKDVPAGGQYAVILAKMVEGDGSESNGIVMQKQVGSILYASVDGQTRKEGKVIENKVPSFLFAPPIQATSVVENTGNIHVEAKYILQVFPLFGNEEVYTNEEDPETRLILPETRRFNTITWDGAPQLGIFKVRQTVEFLGEKSVTEKVVFLCPIWFLLIILVLVFLAVFWIVSRSRGRKED